MENDIVKRLAGSGVLAASTALASLLATRVAAYLWRRILDEEPPE
jgi:hypothetical protein